MSYLARSSAVVGSVPTPPGVAGASVRSPTELRRPAERLPTPGAFQAPVRLVLRAQPQPLRYAVTTRWEERCYAEVTRTIVQKELLLSSVAHGGNLRVSWLASEPTLRKPDLLALEELVVTLAGIYQKLVIDTSPAGGFLALANHPEIVAAWDRIEQELVARYGEAEELTKALRAAVAAQVAAPALLLGSLAHDYAYHLLVANLYEQRFESGWGYGQARAFPHFLADTGVHFHERLELGDSAAPGRATLLVRGRLDEQRTDRAAVARQVAAALATIGPPTGPPPDSAALTFAYRARYDLDMGTGWPVAVAATITCISPAGYAKEYDLTVQQL